MGSSLPRHGAREGQRHKRNNQKKKKKTNNNNKQKPRADCKLNQKNIETTIYMMHEQINVMMHALMQ